MSIKSLITICKSFVRPYLEYYDGTMPIILLFIGNQNQFNMMLHQLYQVYYEEPRKKKYIRNQALNFLQQRRIQRKLSYFYKIFGEQSPDYVSRVIPKQNTRHVIELIMNISKPFSLVTKEEWNMLDSSIRSYKILMLSKFLEFTRSEVNLLLTRAFFLLHKPSCND